MVSHQSCEFVGTWKPKNWWQVYVIWQLDLMCGYEFQRAFFQHIIQWWASNSNNWVCDCMQISLLIPKTSKEFAEYTFRIEFCGLPFIGCTVTYTESGTPMLNWDSRYLLSFLNWNGWNLVSRHIFSRYLDMQNFSSLSLVLS